MTSASVAAPPVDGLRLVGTLILLVRTIEQQVRRSAGAGMLALSDLALLGQLDRGADCPSQLARSLRMDPARVTHVTDRLVDLGYVARTNDRTDRRRWRLSLTSTGAACLAVGRIDTLAAVDSLLAGLSPEERAAVAIALNGIRRLLDRPVDEAAPATEAS